MWTDDLTQREATYMEDVSRELASVSWAGPLLQHIEASGGVCKRNKSFLFEARFAYALHRAGATAEYEFAAGVGDSTVDFLIHGKPEWLVELVSLQETEAVKNAVRESDGFYTLQLRTDAEKEGESEEAEMIRALMKIGEKVEADGIPTKFPVPGGRIHMVFVDTRGYGAAGGDAGDFIQMANGAQMLPHGTEWITHWWQGNPIRGLFEACENHPLKAARAAREHLHFLGFIAETGYTPTEIMTKAYYRANQHLVHSNTELIRLARTFPLCAER